MNGKLPTKLQGIPVHSVILFFEGHVFKALGNSFVPSGIHHKFILIRSVGSPTRSKEFYWQLPRRRELGLVMILTIG